LSEAVGTSRRALQMRCTLSGFFTPPGRPFLQLFVDYCQSFANFAFEVQDRPIRNGSKV
jgi:hypothetical protein